MASLISCSITSAGADTSEIKSEIIGTWLAGETFMPQPPSDMQQDIKAITFEANGTVKWSIAKDGKIQEMIGRYEIFVDEKSSRRLPSIFVAPVSYKNPGISSVCLLLLTDVTIDKDERFNPEKVGKVLKAKRKDGKYLVFVKKK